MLGCFYADQQHKEFVRYVAVWMLLLLPLLMLL